MPREPASDVPTGAALPSQRLCNLRRGKAFLPFLSTRRAAAQGGDCPLADGTPGTQLMAFYAIKLDATQNYPTRNLEYRKPALPGVGV